MSAEGETLVRWAQRAGDVALPIFGVSLVLLLLGVAVAAWAWELPRVRRLRVRRSEWPPLLQLALLMTVGFAVIVLAAQVFAELAEGVLARDVLGRADQALADALRASLPPPALQMFGRITHLGDTVTLTVLGTAVAIGLLANQRFGLALAWVVAVGGNGLLNTTLKQIFMRVRPVHSDAAMVAEGYSFPSGHSSGSLVAYGMLAYLALRLLPRRWHLPAVLAASTVAFTVAASRIFIGVHFASDVLAGLASGAAWLAVCIAGVEFTLWWHARPGRPTE